MSYMAYSMVHFVTDKGEWPPAEWHERNYTIGKVAGRGNPSNAHLAEYVREREQAEPGTKVLGACLIHRKTHLVIATYKA